jgi:hypothetical protein
MELFKPTKDKIFVLPDCEKCLQFGTQISLEVKGLSDSEISKKIHNRKDELPYKDDKLLIFLFKRGYDYLECPKCGFWKFTKKLEWRREKKK